MEQVDKVLEQASSAIAYLTVQEFAERAGVSNQAVYERIRKDLEPYVVKQGGRKMISAEALAFVGNNQAEKQVEQVNQVELLENQLNQVENQSSNQSNSQVEQSSLLEYLIEENERLREEIKQKDKQIAAYADKFAGYVEQMADIARKEQEISTRALDATGRAQMLHAISEQTETSYADTTGEADRTKEPWWRKIKKK